MMHYCHMRIRYLFFEWEFNQTSWSHSPRHTSFRKKRSSLKAGFILVYFINARIRAYAPHWATSIANIAPRRCVVNYKYEHTRVYACKWPWRLYPLVERDPRKRIWLDEISTPALKVQLVWTLGRTYARIRAQNCTLGVWTVQRMRAYTRARSMNPA